MLWSFHGFVTHGLLYSNRESDQRNQIGDLICSPRQCDQRGFGLLILQQSWRSPPFCSSQTSLLKLRAADFPRRSQSLSCWQGSLQLKLLAERIHKRSHMCCHLTAFLVGGFKDFLFSPYLGKWSKLTNIFHMGWDHQLDFCWCFLLLFFPNNSWKWIPYG